MRKTSIEIFLPIVTAFRIPESTRLTVCFFDKDSKLLQTCTLSRKRDMMVNVRFKEYSGHYFNIGIDLRTHTATLLSPDFSWAANPERTLQDLVDMSEEMAVSRRSTKSTRITRAVAPLATESRP